MNWPARFRYAAIVGATFAAATVLGACERANEPPKAADASVPMASSPPLQTPQSMPKADSTDTVTGRPSDEPMKSMSKDEEAASMPRPGQANDHSTLAKDPQR